MYIQEDYNVFLDRGKIYDYYIIDPPWEFNNKINLLHRYQLSYNLWDNNKDCLESLFNKLDTKYIFLWATNSLLDDIFDVTNKTKYKYKTLITWVKTTKNNKIFYGLGNTFRNSTEQLLFFQDPKAKCLRLSERNVCIEESGKRTTKPKKFEVNLINLLNNKNLKGCYIFSGYHEELIDKIDCIDILDENS